MNQIFGEIKKLGFARNQRVRITKTQLLEGETSSWPVDRSYEVTLDLDIEYGKSIFMTTRRGENANTSGVRNAEILGDGKVTITTQTSVYLLEKI